MTLLTFSKDPSCALASSLLKQSYYLDQGEALSGGHRTHTGKSRGGASVRACSQPWALQSRLGHIGMVIFRLLEGEPRGSQGCGADQIFKLEPKRVESERAM